jgi:CheY-like chemotaxis protein
MPRHNSQKPVNIYIVDNDDSVCRALGRLLRSAGFEPVLLASVAALRAGLPQDAQGCLIVDVRIPGLADTDFLRDLCPSHSSIPVICLSSLDDEPSRGRAHELGSVRVGYERWSLRTEVIYLGLGADKGGVSADIDQWLVEPTLSYQICEYFEPLAGARYNNINVELTGVGLPGDPRAVTELQAWWDPIVGGNIVIPLGEAFAFRMRGDIGGFGVASDLTWQAFPHFTWRAGRSIHLHVGYRWVYTDYETGSGTTRFKYDVLSQGPQFGATIHFP